MVIGYSCAYTSAVWYDLISNGRHLSGIAVLWCLFIEALNRLMTANQSTHQRYDPLIDIHRIWCLKNTLSVMICNSKNIKSITYWKNCIVFFRFWSQDRLHRKKNGQTGREIASGRTSRQTDRQMGTCANTVYPPTWGSQRGKHNNSPMTTQWSVNNSDCWKIECLVANDFLRRFFVSPKRAVNLFYHISKCLWSLFNVYS